MLRRVAAVAAPCAIGAVVLLSDRRTDSHVKQKDITFTVSRRTLLLRLAAAAESSEQWGLLGCAAFVLCFIPATLFMIPTGVQLCEHLHLGISCPEVRA
eukprot:s9616_g1.t1